MVTGLAALGGCAQPSSVAPLTLFAAVSLTDVLTELAARFTADTGRPVRTVFAGSGEIARQVEVGAPADLVILADSEWMDRLAAARAIRPDTRIDLLTNSLVVIAPADRSSKPFAWQGRIAIGDPDSVPAGRYARQMMQRLGVWDTGTSTRVTAADVRAVRAFVARGDVDLGVVYRSDALGFDAVRVVATPTAAVQPRIIYPAALTTGARARSDALMTFLRSTPARIAFERHGFGAAA
ncbi:molybdate ABC transporter substrate-binding protein [Brevundimonas subvibrioides]|uniref:Molybdenum ABC transporter, periplasmic molybdate-binding protein n=1 Tax=Brevundimonas subvibrioides (strain ATCC 15264 / DSM 4735 / LMG 14903 / NBRC 16000 / CB 81) TaxID=633149 RepID=D9QIC4_BRESC|nr:molybdate ABC transporter substrate-binding protein [Brevundimonas subvibrioides]ADK99426.1 molybdenum ABC transporter, periplasmic molybdate-binding protein [Brevundimonas subvibrioides ATCC 15264]